jgi:Predicted nucleic acid-binding protein, contains PIN domain
VVIDASIAASWFLRSQATNSATVLYRRAAAEQFVTPIYFAVEVRSILLLGERRGILDPSAADGILAKLAVLLTIEQGDVAAEAENAMPIARQSGLKLYDAIYLQKALAEGRPLASRDSQLLEAAVRCGVETYDGRDPIQGN